MTTRYPHMPDFDDATIVSRPSNDTADGPLVISAMCVCGDVNHAFTGYVYESDWTDSNVALTIQGTLNSASQDEKPDQAVR
jgi:hypothetical protein